MIAVLLFAWAAQDPQVEWLPSDLLYPHPLADPRGPFTGSRVQVPLRSDRHRDVENAFGDYQSLFRISDGDEAFEIAGEGAAFGRFDLEENLDMDGVDFRVGFPFVYRRGEWAVKLHPWHITSHLGDEIIEREGLLRIPYARNELALGVSWRAVPAWRLYAEGGWGFSIDDPNDPWRWMAGGEVVDRLLGADAPEVYLAVNATSWKETDWEIQWAAQAGVWLRSTATPSGLRAGVEYFRGPSALTQFFRERDHYVSAGVWIHF
ncbi:MAG TPA: DUF1207 domain-containing protein [Planctomycetota bacterium]|nr:DUF1207 domain-containing protein [Planctomycetota bacterium]